jgi:glucose-1-phosphate cytidylyltransferase
MSITLDMPVVILAGGLGTRLASETEYRPKPLVKVGHQPILWHLMKIYSHHGFKNFIICLGYKGEMIREYFYHYRLNTGDVLLETAAERFTPLRSHQDEVDWKIILADTGKNTMTGGRIARIKDYIGSDEFLVTYGDGLADIDVGAVVKTHRAHGRIATVTGVHPTSSAAFTRSWPRTAGSTAASSSSTASSSTTSRATPPSSSKRRCGG